jgi:beta-lactamase regulating signal transducer with metallopeptidase domain
MMAETTLTALVRINLVASVAIVLVIALRPFVLRWLGGSVAYWFWLVVPIAAAASMLPAREAIVVIQPTANLLVEAVPAGPGAIVPAPADGTSVRLAATGGVPVPAFADLLLVAWLLGAVALLVRSIAITRRLAADPSIGPALVGVLRPRLVLPPDFSSRFDAEERALILAHEDMHRASGHTIVNALVEVARCACWFNPLAHLAAVRIRADQEIACDAAVIAARPAARRAYGQALLKTQVAPVFLRLGCTWSSRSTRRLAERIATLSRPSLSRRGAIVGASAVAMVSLTLGYTAWAQQPDRIVTQTTARPEAVWTPSSEAPPDTLSHALEAQRHDYFIELARAGNIDLVFFGTTETEMWWWPDRGRSVWNRAFESIRAANFGSQGTQPVSLLWRMRHGELDGYHAKLIVLQAGRDGEVGNDRADVVEGYAALINEIRVRQPQARILLFAPLPRGRSREAWRQRAQANAAVFARFVDDETVFYADIGERFYHPDGSFNGALWSLDFDTRGTQTSAYEIWADELRPWLDRFVR